MSELTDSILKTAATKTEALGSLLEREEAAQKRGSDGQKFAQARAEILAMEPLHITTAVELPKREKQNLLAQVRRLMGKQILLELKCDSQLVGGCTLSYQGVSKDYSLKVRLEILRAWK